VTLLRPQILIRIVAHTLIPTEVSLTGMIRLGSCKVMVQKYGKCEIRKDMKRLLDLHFGFISIIQSSHINKTVDDEVQLSPTPLHTLQYLRDNNTLLTWPYNFEIPSQLLCLSVVCLDDISLAGAVIETRSRIRSHIYRTSEYCTGSPCEG